ncbi:MAG: hypothetical protein JJT96_20165 [Opitutales bacterium]|nr:hypothetical protein [Opitutales bacterium]
MILSTCFSIRLRDDLRPLEQELLNHVARELPAHLARNLIQQCQQIVYIDRFDPKHYIACFTGRAGSFYSEDVLFPFKQTECKFALVDFKIEGVDDEFHARLYAVRGGFWGFKINPFFKKILHRTDLKILRIRVFPEMLDESLQKKT